MSVRFLVGDCRKRLKDLPDEFVQCAVTSPSYFNLRDYQTATWEGGDASCDHGVRKWDGPKQTQGAQSSHASKADRLRREVCHCGAKRVDQQIGLESTPEEYIQTMVEVFREVRRILRDDGVVWLNIGDSYAGSGKGGNPPESPHQKQATNAGSITVVGRATKAEVVGETARIAAKTKFAGEDRNFGYKPKDLIGIPWMLAFALRADGWHLRQDIIWEKPNPMPESVRDRCTKSHEYVFLLTKSSHYFYDADAVAEAAVGTNEHDVTGPGYSAPGQAQQTGSRKPRAAGNKSHKYVDAYEGSDTEEHRTKAGLMNIAGTAYAVRNKRSVWSISPLPFREAHFATMPPALAEICIKAGTSEKGCCASCGSPWRRVTEKQATGKVRQRSTGGLGTEVRRETHGLDAVDGTFQDGVQYVTVGWEATCKCVDAGEPVPCTVLDPFSGAGTTALVADRLKRNAIGSELNPDYAKMAVDRITGEAGMFADVTVDYGSETRGDSVSGNDSEDTAV